ncbi:MAG TPA: hypothetical protein VKA49_03785 [Flavitalea sp.]|nr:hypothetical protein [Flavitalea sp.]
MDIQTKILVFKTNLETEEGIRAVSAALNQHPEIIRWNVDQWDIDKVLRIEACTPSSPSSIIEMIRSAGFVCDELPD